MSNKTDNSRALRILDNNIIKEKRKKKKEEVGEKAKKSSENVALSRTNLENLAEERRLALEEALKDNQRLHETLLTLQEEVTELKALAIRAELLEEIARELMRQKWPENCDDSTTD